MRKTEDKYLDYLNCLNRLKTEYEYYGNLFIAVDFDHTLYDFDEVGDTYYKVIKEIKRAQSLNLDIILYTCRENEKLDFAIDHCKKIGINPKYINENPLLNTRKVYYSLFLDDRAGLGESYRLLCDILDYIEKIKCIKYPKFITCDDNSIFILVKVLDNSALYYMPSTHLFVTVNSDLKSSDDKKYYKSSDERYMSCNNGYVNCPDIEKTDLLTKIIKELNL
ncbi:MAG: hypothetical protein RSE41_04730 [Clostridia bacterium]